MATGDPDGRIAQWLSDLHTTTGMAMSESMRDAKEEWFEEALQRLDLALATSEDCRRCGSPNVIWSCQSPLWNYVMRGNDINGEPRYHDLVCMPCFIVCAVEAGLPAHGWRLTLTPEPEGLIYETPSGRVWDAERFLWVEPTPDDHPTAEEQPDE